MQSVDASFTWCHENSSITVEFLDTVEIGAWIVYIRFGNIWFLDCLYAWCWSAPLEPLCKQWKDSIVVLHRDYLPVDPIYGNATLGPSIVKLHISLKYVVDRSGRQYQFKELCQEPLSNIRQCHLNIWHSCLFLLLTLFQSITNLSCSIFFYEFDTGKISSLL